MTQRAQIITLAVLFVALVGVFLLVGDAGVTTDVFSAEPTVAPPTATPEPPLAASAEHWEADSENEYSFTADPNVDATITVRPQTLSSLAAENGWAAPAEDDAYGLNTLLANYVPVIEGQIAQLGLSDYASTGPVTELFGGEPVTYLHYEIQPQTGLTGQSFPGLDLILGWIDTGDGSVMQVEYNLTGELNPTVYQSFRLWLVDNAAGFVEEAEADEEISTEGESDAETETDAGEEAENDAETEGETDAEAETETEGEVEAETEAEADEQSALPEENAETAADIPEWSEMGPGQWLNTNNPNLMVFHSASTVEAMDMSLNLEPVEGDEARSHAEYLTLAREQIMQEMAAQGVTVAEDSPEEIFEEEFDGVPVTFIRIRAAAQEQAEGDPMPSQELAIAMLDRADGSYELIQYISQGDAADEYFEAFRRWLTDNAAALAAQNAPAGEATGE